MLLQTQLSVELTNVFGCLSKVVPWKKVLDLGRDLRKSGSGLVVEEDFANVVGRGKLVFMLLNFFFKGCGYNLCPLGAMTGRELAFLIKRQTAKEVLVGAKWDFQCI